VEANTGGKVVAMAQDPVVARPAVGYSTTQNTSIATPPVNRPAVLDRGIVRLTTGAAVSNPDLGYVNRRS